MAGQSLALVSVPSPPESARRARELSLESDPVSARFNNRAFAGHVLWPSVPTWDPRRLRFVLHALALLVVLVPGAVHVAAAPSNVVARAVTPFSPGQVGFKGMSPSETGLAFTNTMGGDLYLTNAVAHNGAGVAVGDVDGDGWADVYLCNLEGPNQLFRNQGAWRFEPINQPAIACADQRSTAAALVDVDGDRDLDLLVNGIGVGTRLFLNDSAGRFTESPDSGLSRTASATSMALADIDGDGDLDLYCTHFIDVMRLADPSTRFALTRKGDGWEVSKINGESTRSAKWKGRFEATPDGKVRELPEYHGFYRNEGQGRFKAIEHEPGTFADAAGNPIPPYRDWGLAVMFRDINGDGLPDLYVCNDNTSPDRIRINQGGARFRELEGPRLRHTSRSAMGVDFADVDRDGRDDFFVVDMLAREHRFRMTQLVRDRPARAETELPEARPQFNRNTLFLGQPGGYFAEVAWMAGLAASDWTWSTLFLDVDLDGFEDLLLTNGFEFDVMDQDSHNEIKEGRRLTDAQLKRSMQMHPRWRTRNVAFRNAGSARFEPAPAWGFDLQGISYGMAAGDLDNDGDLDLVVNNLNAPASIYQNTGTAPRVAVRLRGRAPNSAGIGARISLVSPGLTQSQEVIAGGRYLSSDDPVRVFAFHPTRDAGARLSIRWRSGRESVVEGVEPNRIYEVAEPEGPPPTPAPTAPATTAPARFEDVSAALNHVHVDEDFDDWALQPTLPRRLSRLGPGLAWFDVDGDGWEDLLVAGGRDGSLGVLRNQQGRAWSAATNAPKATGDQSAVLGWHDGRGSRAILVSLSNAESPPGTASQLEVYPATDPARPASIPLGNHAPGPMVTTDVDGDGDLDLWVGGRTRAGRYPEAVPSQWWLNEGGRLVADPARSAAFATMGMAVGACAVDLDRDGDPDLVVASEWGPVRIFINGGASFRDATEAWGLSGKTGLWTGVATGDFNGDGLPDLVCGNWGRNSQYELYAPADLRLFHGDWSGDGVIQVLEAWRAGADWWPVHDRTWLSLGIPRVASEFKTHADFATANVPAILRQLGATNAAWVGASELSSVVLLNRGSNFDAIPLPAEAQRAPVFSVCVGDLDGDGIQDLFCSQNFFGTASDLTREDGGFGLALQGRGDGTFAAWDAEAAGIRILGEQRGAALADFDHDGRLDIAVAQNRGATRLFRNRSATPGLRVALKGGAGNPEGVGAELRLEDAQGRLGPMQTVGAGSGYGSQDAAVRVVTSAHKAVALRVRWPKSREVRLPLNPTDRSVEVPIPAAP